MREIFCQYEYSCSQAAAIGYMFTYEINCARGYSSDHDTSMYHPSFTYNFLNKGLGSGGSYIHEGLEILKEMGCPTIHTYGSSILGVDSTEWITGYDKYFKAIKNRIDAYETIDLISDSGLYEVKHWIHNHNASDTVGGITVFSVKNPYSFNKMIITEGQATGKSIIVSCDSSSLKPHALTIVGYNDSIKIDVDSSGTYEENEIGGFKLANTWGNDYPTYEDSGYVYVLYSVFPDTSLFLYGRYSYICHAQAEYTPEIIIKTGMTNPNRKYFNVQLGYDTIAAISNKAFRKPEVKTISYHKAGEHKLTGLNSINDTLELCLDFTYQYNKFYNENIGEIFFRPHTLIPYADSGMLWYGSMIDYRWNDSLLLKLRNIPDTMEYSEEWKFSVDYDLLPFSISNDTSVNTNQIYRLNDTIKEGASLTIGNVHPAELHLQNTG